MGAPIVARGQGGFRAHGLPGFLLALLAVVAYGNAWPNVLVFDDGFFVTQARFADVGWADFGRFFLEDLWAAYGTDSELYRPLFVSVIALQRLMFGDWAAGFHLVNIGLHAAVTVLVYRLVDQLLLAHSATAPYRAESAFLAAAVFAVHPVHAETVNSIFNGSELWVSLGVIGGSWFLLKKVDSQPLRAWAVVGAIYLATLFTRESAIVLPALALTLVWLFTPGGWGPRLRRSWPALLLVLPLALYLGMRMSALGDAAFPGAGYLAEIVGAPDLIVEQQAQATDTLPPSAASDEPADIPDPAAERRAQQINLAEPAVALAQSWHSALALMVWPHPLRIIHYAEHVSPWLAFTSQIALAVTALLLLLRRRHPGLLAGLAIFYLAVLPVTLYTAFGDHGVSIQERYLYLPTVGLSVVLGFALTLLAESKGPRPAVIVSLLALMLMLPATWSRNGDWASNVALFESDYQRGEPSAYLLSQLVQAHNAAGNYRQSALYCDRHKEQVNNYDALSEDCGWTYQRLLRLDDAERAFLRAAHSRQTGAAARRKLAELYLGQGRREEAQEQFALSIEQEQSPAMQEYRKAHRVFALFPDDAQRLREADSHLERALELQPGLVIAEELRQQVTAKRETLPH